MSTPPEEGIPLSENSRRIGETHPGAKLTDEQVGQLRDEHEFRGAGARFLARKYGVPLGTVRKIIYYQRRATLAHRWMFKHRSRGPSDEQRGVEDPADT